MRIGIPKEIKEEEHRVAATPAGVAGICRPGHTVLVETGAGSPIGFTDGHYRAAGAEVPPDRPRCTAELVYKVKEPRPARFPFCAKARSCSATCIWRRRQTSPAPSWAGA